MVRRLVLGGLIVLAAATQASANGRPAGTSTINFKLGNNQEIYAGMTFGAAVSHDGGATWYWMCEAAVGYGGMYDPDYVYASTGAVFATTFDGLKVMRDGCSFEGTLRPHALATPTGLVNPVIPVDGSNFVSSVALGTDGMVLAAEAEPAGTAFAGDSNIYQSTDDGRNFPDHATPGQVNDWWQSLELAPSDPQRVYLFGYRLVSGAKTYLLFRSNNGGTSYAPMSQTAFVTAQNSVIEFAGMSRTNPDIVFARVTLENNSVGDAIYRSTNGGGAWTRVLGIQADIAFVVRANGDLVAGTKTEGSVVSHDNGDTWIPLVAPPHINCLYENAAGEVWACTQNYGSNQVQSDGAGIMKSTDLATWTPVLKFEDIKAPVTCPAGTAQQDKCVAMWCGLKAQLGIISDFGNCPLLIDAPGGDDTTVKPPKGCCQTGDPRSAPIGLALGAVVALVVLRRRRRA